MRSRTATAEIAQVVLNLNGRIFHLIDTPGFDDTYRSVASILKEVASFLAAAYQNQRLLAGVVYLHPINLNRMSGSMLRNLDMFKAIVGNNNVSRVVLATTKWDLGEAQILEQREKEIRAHFWAPLLEKGCKMLRLYGNRAEALHILDSLAPSEPAETAEDNQYLQIQEELVDGRKMLSQTAAGLTLSTDFLKFKAALKKAQRSLEEEIESDSNLVDSELISRLEERDGEMM